MSKELEKYDVLNTLNYALKLAEDCFVVEKPDADIEIRNGLIMGIKYIKQLDQIQNASLNETNKAIANFEYAFKVLLNKDLSNVKEWKNIKQTITLLKCRVISKEQEIERLEQTLQHYKGLEEKAKRYFEIERLLDSKSHIITDEELAEYKECRNIFLSLLKE
jgi:hypothetical protein